MTSVRTILGFCRDRGIRFLAICDHDRNEGSRAAVKLAVEYGVTVVPAIEYSTDSGDVIGLFCDATTELLDANAVVDLIHREGGIAVLPHPYRGHKLDRIALEKLDVIEVFNPRLSDADNAEAEALAQRLGKAKLVGADAHLPWELGNALNRYRWEAMPADDLGALRTAIMSQVPEAKRHATSFRNKQISAVIKGVKHRRPTSVLKSAVLVVAGQEFRDWLRRVRA
jgi:hypothetical protein